MERHRVLLLHQPTGWASSKWLKSHHSPVLAFTSPTFTVTAVIASAEHEIKRSSSNKKLPSSQFPWLHQPPLQCHSKRLPACLPACQQPKTSHSSFIGISEIYRMHKATWSCSPACMGLCWVSQSCPRTGTCWLPAARGEKIGFTQRKGTKCPCLEVM